MTEVQKLQKEIADMTAKRKAIKEANSVVCGGPKLTRAYTYRKSPAITAGDVRSL